MNNPYVIDRPLTNHDLYYGQETVFAQLVLSLEQGQRLFVLFGRPRIGKTSFLNQLELRLGKEYLPRRVDWQAVADEHSEPLWRIAVALAQVLELTAPDRASFETNGDAYVTDLLAPLLSAPGATTYLICLDGIPGGDFQENQAWQLAIKALCSLLRPNHSLAVLLAIDGHAPVELWEGVARLMLRRLPEVETEDLLMLPARGALSYDHEAVRLIHRLSGGMPYLAQLLGHAVFEKRVKSGWLGLPDVEQVIPQVTAQAQELLQATWDECSPSARVVLCTFAERLGSHGLASARDIGDYLSRSGIQAHPQEIERALAELLQLDILDLLGEQTYRLASELFRRWIGQSFKAADLARRGGRQRRSPRRSFPLFRGRRIDWVSALLWAVAGILAVLIMFVWRTREILVFWTSEPTPAVRLAASSVIPAPPPTPERGVVPGCIVYMAKETPDDYWAIYSMRADGTDPVRLTNAESNNTSPLCSSDGRHIAFVTDRDGNREIYVMNADGNEQINLSGHPAEDWTPTWSPDGEQLAFASFRDGNWEIYVMDASGGEARRLTNNEAADYSPSWSPDGSLIAFVSNRDGNLDIYVMDSDGSGQARFTYHEASDQSPTWTPDSEQLLWESYREGNMEIYAAYLDGSEMRNLSQDAYADDHGPTCSPWSKRIAFFSNRDGGWDIYTLDLETGERANITMSAMLEQAPFWSR